MHVICIIKENCLNKLYFHTAGIMKNDFSRLIV